MILRDEKGKILKGAHLSPETEFKKGIHPKTEFKKGCISLMEGKHHSEETKRKIKLAKLGKHHTEKTKKKISETEKGRCNFWLKNKNLTEEHRRKIGEGNKGKMLSEEHRKIISKNMMGNKHGWKGGINPLSNQIRNNFRYSQWRDNIFYRDNYTCQECGQIGGKLNAHHVKSFSSILQYYEITTIEEALECEELWNMNNGITLCEDCHKKTDDYLIYKKTKINRG